MRCSPNTIYPQPQNLKGRGYYGQALKLFLTRINSGFVLEYHTCLGLTPVEEHQGTYKSTAGSLLEMETYLHGTCHSYLCSLILRSLLNIWICTCFIHSALIIYLPINPLTFRV